MILKVNLFISNQDNGDSISNGNGIIKFGYLLKNASIFLKETKGPSFNWHHRYVSAHYLTVNRNLFRKFDSMWNYHLLSRII